MKTMTGAMVAALVLTLGGVGCRENQNTAGDTARNMEDPVAGAATTPVDEGQRVGADPMQPAGATEGQMQAFRVESIEEENVTLVPQSATMGERDPQAGSEISVEKSEFQNLAGFEAKEGDMVHLQLGQDGKPSKIERPSGHHQDPQGIQQGSEDYQQPPPPQQQ